MDHETPELIEAQMAETRQSLTEKVAALEDSVVGTVQSATTAVSDTVQSVKDAVGETVDAVKSNVTNALDLSHHVRQSPWVSLGVAAFAGFLTGVTLLRRQNTAGVAFGPAVRYDPTPATAPPPRTLVPPREVAPAAPGMFDTLLHRIGQEVAKLGEAAIEKVTAELHRAVDDGVPRLVDKIPFAAPGPQSEQPVRRAS